MLELEDEQVYCLILSFTTSKKEVNITSTLKSDYAKQSEWERGGI